MKNTKIQNLVLWASILLLLLVATATIPAMYSFNEQARRSPINQLQTIDSRPYDGHLRIYIAEPQSRWSNSAGGSPIQYHYGFLDFAFDDSFSLEYDSTFSDSIIWDGTQNGWSDIQEDNIIVMAAVFNPESFEKFSDPPSGCPFDAHYVDAAAAARPGMTDYNCVTDEFTHTVFVTEGTATFCGPCRYAMAALENIDDSNDYPFYYISMVVDKNSVASSHMTRTYNLYGVPAVYFDGGARVQIGASSSIESTYRNMIESTGKRDVHEFNLSLSVQWLGNAQLQIDISITNNEPMNPPETPSPPEGPSMGYAGIEYDFNVQTTDPEGNRIIYIIDWGDGTVEESRSTSSGTPAQFNHRWADPGTYDIKVKARDTGGGGYESGWSAPTEIVIEPPLFDITITGGLFEVSALIVNDAEETFTEVNWSMSVSGGILDGILVQDSGGFPELAPGIEKKVAPHDNVFGFGSIDIEVMVEDTQKTATGFVFGPFVRVR